MAFSEIVLLALSMLALWGVLEFSTRRLIPKVRKRYYPNWFRFLWNIIILIFVWKFAQSLGVWKVVCMAVVISFVLEKLFPVKSNNNTYGVN
jgi:hypothetical protein